MGMTAAAVRAAQLAVVHLASPVSKGNNKWEISLPRSLDINVAQIHHWLGSLRDHLASAVPQQTLDLDIRRDDQAPNGGYWVLGWKSTGMEESDDALTRAAEQVVQAVCEYLTSTGHPALALRRYMPKVYAVVQLHVSDDGSVIVYSEHPLFLQHGPQVRAHYREHCAIGVFRRTGCRFYTHIGTVMPEEKIKIITTWVYQLFVDLRQLTGWVSREDILVVKLAT